MTEAERAARVEELRNNRKIPDSAYFDNGIVADAQHQRNQWKAHLEKLSSVHGARQNDALDLQPIGRVVQHTSLNLPPVP